MKKIFYRDDFTVVINFTNADGEATPIPDGVDFAGRLYTVAGSAAASVAFSRVGGEYFGCAPLANGVAVHSNDHTLKPGRVTAEIVYNVADEAYPDGRQRITRTYPLDIELSARVVLPDDAEATIAVPVVNVRIDPATEARLLEFSTQTRAAVTAARVEAQAAARSAAEAATAAQEARGEAEALRDVVEAMALEVDASAEAARTAAADAVAGVRSEIATAKSQAVSEAKSYSDAADTALRSAIATAKEDAKKESQATTAGYVQTLRGEIATAKEEAKSHTDAAATTLRGEIATAKAEAHTDAAALVAAAKEALFIDLWTEACEAFGSYNASNPDAPYTLVGLNLTYAEALTVYNAGAIRDDANNLYRGHNIRVNLPNKGHSSFSLTYTFYGCTAIEVAFVFTGVASSSAFYNCPKLRQVGTPIRKLYTINGDIGKKAYLLCPSLEIVYGTIRGTYGIDVRDSPLLTLDNFKNWVATAANTAAITITVHPDIYTKLTSGDAEWQALVPAAAAKNITFTTI